GLRSAVTCVLTFRCVRVRCLGIVPSSRPELLFVKGHDSATFVDKLASEGRSWVLSCCFFSADEAAPVSDLTDHALESGHVLVAEAFHEAAQSRSGVGAGVEYLVRSEEHTSELQSRFDLVCRLLLVKKKKKMVME